jgi:hypothetical protein
MIDNYGSVIFNLIYLIIIWIIIVIVTIKNLNKEKTSEWKFAYWSFFLLGFGDLFHLLSRTFVFFESLNYSDGQTAYYLLPSTIFWIGFGMMMTGITVQFFYVGFYYYWRVAEKRKRMKINNFTDDEAERSFLLMDLLVISASIVRVVLIFYPQNQYGQPAEDLNIFRLLTNIPLYIVGILIIYLFLKRSSDSITDLPGFLEGDKKVAKQSAVWIIVSYVCYSLTIFLSWWNPLFGLAMIPKTIAYLVVLFIFYKHILIIKQ